MKRNKIPHQEIEMNLIYKRRLSKSVHNKASVITIPRSIANAWEPYNSVELIFDGERLVIKPSGVDRDDGI